MNEEPDEPARYIIEYTDVAADVRRLLMRPWRLLYQIIEPQEGEAAGFVRVRCTSTTAGSAPARP